MQRSKGNFKILFIHFREQEIIHVSDMEVKHSDRTVEVLNIEMKAKSEMINEVPDLEPQNPEQLEESEKSDDPKTNKLEALSHLLKTNPEMLEIIDSDDDSKLSVFIKKIHQDEENKQDSESNKNKDINDLNENQKDTSNQQPNDTIVEQEPSEKSFSDYTIQNEINILNSNISNTNENGITSMVTSQQNTQRKLDIPETEKPFIDANKRLGSEIETIAEEKSNLEDTIENKITNKSEIIPEEFEKAENIKLSHIKESSPKSSPFHENSLKLSELKSESDKNSDIVAPKIMNEDLLVKEFELSPSKQKAENKQKASQLLEFLENDEMRSSRDYTGAIKDYSHNTMHSAVLEPNLPSLGGVMSTDLKSQVVSQEIELKECYNTIEALKQVREKQDASIKEQRVELESDTNKKLETQKQEYESQLERHITFIDQLINDK